MTVIKWLSCLWWNIVHATLWYLYVFWLHFPIFMCIVSTICIMLKCWSFYLALLNLYLRDPSLKRKASFFLKWFFAVTCGIYLLQPGYILSVNIGYYLKPSGYTLKDWNWLVKKVVWKVKLWSGWYLSLGGRLVLIRVVLQGIPVFWFSLFKVLKSIIKFLKRFIYLFIYLFFPSFYGQVKL